MDIVRDAAGEDPLSEEDMALLHEQAAYKEDTLVPFFHHCFDAAISDKFGNTTATPLAIFQHAAAKAGYPIRFGVFNDTVSRDIVTTYFDEDLDDGAKWEASIREATACLQGSHAEATDGVVIATDGHATAIMWRTGVPGVTVVNSGMGIGVYHNREAGEKALGTMPLWKAFPLVTREDLAKILVGMSNNHMLTTANTFSPFFADRQLEAGVPLWRPKMLHKPAPHYHYLYTALVSVVRFKSGEAVGGSIPHTLALKTAAPGRDPVAHITAMATLAPKVANNQKSSATTCAGVMSSSVKSLSCMSPWPRAA